MVPSEDAVIAKPELGLAVDPDRDAPTLLSDTARCREVDQAEGKRQALFGGLAHELQERPAEVHRRFTGMPEGETVVLHRGGTHVVVVFGLLDADGKKHFKGGVRVGLHQRYEGGSVETNVTNSVVDR